MSASPLQSLTELPTFSISVNGKVISDTYAVIAVEVARSLNKKALATISLVDGDPATGTFPISDSNCFAFGATVKINAGYNKKESAIFSGTVTKQHIRIDPGHAPALIISCEGNIDAIPNNKPDLTQAPVLTVGYGESILEMNLECNTDNSPIKGTVKFPGSALAEPGKLIELVHVGKRYSGNALISGTHQKIEGGNWLSAVELG